MAYWEEHMKYITHFISHLSEGVPTYPGPNVLVLHNNSILPCNIQSHNYILLSKWPSLCTNSCFIISLLYSSTCFEHYCAHHQEVKLYYTASGIVTLCRWLNSTLNEKFFIQSCRQNQNTHFMFNNFFQKIVSFVRDNVERYCRAGHATDNNIARGHCMLGT